LPRKKKNYKVVGTSPVLGHHPGQTFEASLDKAHEDFLVRVGAIRVEADKKDK